MQAKILQNNSLLIYLLSLVFIIGNLIAIIFQFYWISLLPVVLVLILLYFYAFDKFLLFIVFTIPLSVNLIDKGFNIGMSLPAEPILFIIMLLFFIKLLLLNNYDLKITLHPVSIAIFINLFWLFITSLTSQLPIVSFKYLISRLWFTVVFYFIFVPLFKDLKNLRYFIWTYASSLLIVIAYTIINHSKYNFNELTSH
nr:hypothetical protein [Bacteroidales bacterium]